MARKIPVDVSLDPAVVRDVVEGLVQVDEVVLDPQVGDKCYTVTLCPGRPYAYPVRHITRDKAEHVAEVVRRLAWLAIEEYLRTQTIRPEMIVLGGQALPAECHPDTPRQGPPSTQAEDHTNAGVRQAPAVQATPLEVPDVPDVLDARVAGVTDGRVVGPDLFAGDLSAMGRLLIDVAAATARHALRVQDLKQAARSAAEGIEQVVLDLRLRGRLPSHAAELRQALTRLEELEDH